MDQSGSYFGCGKKLCAECKNCKQETSLPMDRDQYSGCSHCAQCTVCILVSHDQLHTNPTEASLAHPVGIYGKRKAVYDSVDNMTFSLKYIWHKQTGEVPDIRTILITSLKWITHCTFQLALTMLENVKFKQAWRNFGQTLFYLILYFDQLMNTNAMTLVTNLFLSNFWIY